MNDKELANKVVVLGVGEKDTFRPYMYTLGKFESVRYEADKYVRDWRVAGALMEKCRKGHLYSWTPFGEFEVQWGVLAYHHKEVDIDRVDDLPRAIIEACVKVLS